MVNTMARRTDGGVRFRPVGSQRSRTAPVYSPRGTGCPAIEQAVQGLYKGQNEESFWSLMSALNYALELETHVLVPLQTALSAQGAPAPWMEHPIPAEKADGLALWTLRNDKGRCWLPLFTSVKNAEAEKASATRPMVERSLRSAPTAHPAAVVSTDTSRTLESIIGEVVQQTVAAHGGNRAAAARQLGISRTTLWRYLGKLENGEPDQT